MNITPQTLYEIECWRDGALVWTETFHNLVTTAGKTKLLDAVFRTGEAANAWFVGLVDNTSFVGYAVSDIMSSHSGWLEATPYSESVRQAFVASAASAGSIDNGASRAVFSINATGTVRGAFLVDNSTKGGSSGTLYGVGDFTVTRLVVIGDTINVKITITAT